MNAETETCYSSVGTDIPKSINTVRTLRPIILPRSVSFTVPPAKQQCARERITACAYSGLLRQWRYLLAKALALVGKALVLPRCSALCALPLPLHLAMSTDLDTYLPMLHTWLLSRGIGRNGVKKKKKKKSCCCSMTLHAV